MANFNDFESVFKYRRHIAPKAAIFISCEAHELHELIDIMTANGYRWYSDSIPTINSIQHYMEKPMPGVVLYSDHAYYFHEASSVDKDIEYVLKFRDLMNADMSIDIKTEDIFNIIGD